jgi:hypothetical protein
MSATYDPTLPTDRDWVRFLISDTDVVANAQLQDEEIDAVVADETATGEALKYYAAARCLSVLFQRWTSSGHGVIEKQVLQLRIRRGMNESAVIALQGLICDFRKRGADLLARSYGQSGLLRVR